MSTPSDQGSRRSSAGRLAYGTFATAATLVGLWADNALNVVLLAVAAVVLASMSWEAWRARERGLAVMMAVACLLVGAVFAHQTARYLREEPAAANSSQPASASQSSSPTMPAVTASPRPTAATESRTSSQPLTNQPPVSILTDCKTDVAQQPVAEGSICVMFWCKGAYTPENPFVLSNESQQIKMRVKVENFTSHPLNVSITGRSALRLLLSPTDADRWVPPPLTRQAGDRPVRVTINGTTLAAIPPNVRDDVRLVTGRDGAGVPRTSYDGWETTWDYREVPPHGIAYKPPRKENGRVVHEGNLVFQLPLDRDLAMHPIGVALVDPADGNRVIAYQLLGAWGPQSSLHSF